LRRFFGVAGLRNTPPKEKALRGQFGSKFEATIELQRARQSEADELFKKALERVGKGEEET